MTVTARSRGATTFNPNVSAAGRRLRRVGSGWRPVPDDSPFANLSVTSDGAACLIHAAPEALSHWMLGALLDEDVDKLLGKVEHS